MTYILHHSLWIYFTWIFYFNFLLIITQILLDGNFIFACLKFKIDIVDRLEKLLQSGKVKLFILKSVLDEMKLVGQATVSSVDFAEQQCVILNDNATDNQTPIEKYLEYLSMLKLNLPKEMFADFISI